MKSTIFVFVAEWKYQATGNANAQVKYKYSASVLQQNKMRFLFTVKWIKDFNLFSPNCNLFPAQTETRGRGFLFYLLFSNRLRRAADCVMICVSVLKVLWEDKPASICNTYVNKCVCVCVRVASLSFRSPSGEKMLLLSSTVLLSLSITHLLFLLLHLRLSLPLSPPFLLHIFSFC